MEKKQFKKSQISKYQKWKWVIQDMAGLYLIRGITKLSRDPEVEELYQDMRQQLIEEGEQPEAVQTADMIMQKIITNTIQRVGI